MYIRNVFSGLLRIRKALKPTAVPSQFAWTTENKYAELRRTRLVQRQKNAELIEAEEYMEPDDIAAEVTISQTQAYDNTKEYGHSSNEAADKLSAPVCTETGVQITAEPPFNINNFMFDNAGIHYYTGLENHAKFTYVLSNFQHLAQLHTTCLIIHIAVISYLSQINFL